MARKQIKKQYIGASVTHFTGVDQQTDVSQLAHDKAAAMMNYRINDNVRLKKRAGYERIFDTSLGATPIRGMWTGSIDGTDFFIFAHGGNLYKHISGVNTLLDATLADAVTTFIRFTNILYIFDGTNLHSFDGTTVANVDGVNAYNPNILLGRSPDGTTPGTEDEKLNLISPGFTESFNGNAVDTTYVSSVEDLDVTAATGEIITASGTDDVVEDVDFTVNRTTGTYDFSAGSSPYGAPPTGTNNVIMNAFYTHSGFADTIVKCRIAAAFSGTSDTRLHVSGNPDYPNKDWKSGLEDATYFPTNRDDIVGDDKAITGYVLQHDKLDVVKETSVLLRTYKEFDPLTEEASFHTTAMSDKVGCSGINTVQLIRNNPLLVQNNIGVWVLAPPEVGRTELNVDPISMDVNPSLTEKDLSDIITFDHEKNGEYWIVSGDEVWIYNYRISRAVDKFVWYQYDNIPASCFAVDNGDIYFGDNSKGLIYRFDDDLLNDDDGGAGEVAIEHYWWSALFDLGSPMHYKHVVKAVITLKPKPRTSFDVQIASEQGVISDEEEIFTIEAGIFNFDDINFDHFTFNTEGNTALPYIVPIWWNGVIYFQLRISGNALDTDTEILGIKIQANIQSEVL